MIIWFGDHYVEADKLDISTKVKVEIRFGPEEIYVRYNEVVRLVLGKEGDKTVLLIKD